MTPLTITSLDQGKIYKDWTLVAVDDTPSAAKSWLIVRVSALRQHLGMARDLLKIAVLAQGRL
jgi:hypothetical protein